MRNRREFAIPSTKPLNPSNSSSSSSNVKSIGFSMLPPSNTLSSVNPESGLTGDEVWAESRRTTRTTYDTRGKGETNYYPKNSQTPPKNSKRDLPNQQKSPNPRPNQSPSSPIEKTWAARHPNLYSGQKKCYNVLQVASLTCGPYISAGNIRKIMWILGWIPLYPSFDLRAYARKPVKYWLRYSSFTTETPL